MYQGITCIIRDHDLRLVLVAALICGLGSFSTVTLITRAQALPARAAISWLIAAAAVFGCSIWTLHFIAMLAFMRQMPIAYDVRTTVASIAIAVGGVLIAFLVWRLIALRLVGVVLGGAILGLAIAGMHYTGVSAMRLPGHLAFSHEGVALSIACGLALAMLALGRARHAGTLLRQIEVSFWLGLSVFTLHFIGMAALRVVPGPALPTGGNVLGSGILALAVAAVSAVLLAISLAATLVERHLAERTMQEFTRMRVLNDLAHEVMMILRHGIVLEVNSAGARLFGMPVQEIVGMPIERLFAKNSVPVLLRDQMDDVEENWPEEMAITTATGKQVAVEFSSRRIEFQGAGATAIALRDLSERKRNEARIEHLAHHDRLTDLPGRFLLRERLGRAMQAAVQDSTSVAVLHLNLDRFKPINDVVGHAAGDAVLIEVGQRLKQALRATDTLARIGGDEFAIVLTHAEMPGRVSTFANRLLETLDRPILFDGAHISIGASIGVAMYPGDGDDAEALLRAAAAAVDQAKDAALGSVRFFEASTNDATLERRQLQQELRDASQRGELELVYQPVVNCHTGDVPSFEALLRWRHPQSGLISPGAFIPLAEESGAISQIGHWTIDAACAAAASWPVPRGVAVNVSPIQFRTSDVPAIVAAALARTGLDPARLEIEITEGVFIDDAARAVTILSSLRSMGIRLALDDFGTGYSALSYLRLFRFDKIKIDQSFVPDLGHREEATTIVKAIIALGHNLGLTVTVEGVETEDQLAIIRTQGADLVQGYLLGRPAAMDRFSEDAIAGMQAALFTPPKGA
jgi:diguanylate cyclase (GGDEF)-like protein/PAS domain S-box-containing protein